MNAFVKYKAVTFNGNIVIGEGETLEIARANAEKAAANIGSCIRKAVIILFK